MLYLLQRFICIFFFFPKSLLRPFQDQTQDKPVSTLFLQICLPSQAYNLKLVITLNKLFKNRILDNLFFNMKKLTILLRPIFLKVIVLYQHMHNFASKQCFKQKFHHFYCFFSRINTVSITPLVLHAMTSYVQKICLIIFKKICLMIFL